MNDITANIENSLDLLFKLENDSEKNKLLDKGKTVFLQISLFKVPFVAKPRRKFLKLCHSLYGDDPEICLFVPNRKTGVEYKKTTDELIDFCVDYYTELLEKHKVKGITTVMPVKQLRSEYGSYELRRKLVNRFDLFLCKNSLLYNYRFLTALGKIFMKANKNPLGISFPKPDAEYDPQFYKNIKRAIYATSYYIKPFSDNYTVPIGTMSYKRNELEENLKLVLDQILSENLIPGGFRNVRAIYLWPSQSKTIPLYVALDLPKDLPRPRVKSLKKGMKKVVGELSTQPGKKVTVFANGRVIVERLKDSDFKNKSHLGWENDNDNLSFEKNTKLNEEDSDESDENDDVIEEKEARLLREKMRTDMENHVWLKKVRKVENLDRDNTKKSKKVRLQKNSVKKNCLERVKGKAKNNNLKNDKNDNFQDETE